MMRFHKFLFAAVITLAACTPIQAQRGQMVTDDQLSHLIVGTTAKPEIVAAIGTPTTVDSFDDKRWYYIGEDTKQIGIHPPSVTNRRIVALQFDENGTLTNKQILGKEAAQQVTMAPGATKVVGKEPTVVQQLIGNVGRFSGDSASDKGGRP